jgi:hypothetical protein
MSASEEARLSGIDVSHFQGEIDLRAVAAAGVHFAFIKATEGLDDVDPRLLRTGSYHGRPGCCAGPIISCTRTWMRNSRRNTFSR